jgi:hypothetical protein
MAELAIVLGEGQFGRVPVDGVHIRGLTATPASPIPPARESTEIIRNGTAVVMVLS